MTFEEHRKKMEEDAEKILEVIKQKKFNDREAKRRQQKEKKRQENKTNYEWASKLKKMRDEYYENNPQIEKTKKVGVVEDLKKEERKTPLSFTKKKRRKRK